MKKVYGVLGKPIGHSMSPVMHNDLFSFYKIDAHYLPFEVEEEDLQAAVTGLKALKAGGFNVTVPYKSKIIPYLDVVDPLAERIGAVNTVVNEGGKFVGYNTDGPGFLKGLQAILPDVAGKRVLILGAGGAARAIYFTLIQENPQAVDIANRTVKTAQRILEERPKETFSMAKSLMEAETDLGEYDVIIQTTMIGMSPKTTEQIIPVDRLKQQVVVCDIIYNPLATQFLQAAASKGAAIQNGIDMFVYQGALAFEKWTGQTPDMQRMKDNVLKQLGGKTC